MRRSVMQKAFAPVRRFLPKWISDGARILATAFLTPVFYSYRTGHFRSSFIRSAVSRRGEPIPWYTYPLIDFLRERDFKDKTVLEFGGGQSTLWWGKRAKSVVTLENHRGWYDRIWATMPPNVKLHYISAVNEDDYISRIAELLPTQPHSHYDVIIIDGPPRYRAKTIDIACRYLATGGILICDDAERFGIYEGLRLRGLSRIDFYGNAPGVIHPRCTAVYFESRSFVFDPAIPIRDLIVDD